ncbi:hypothetical protein Tco_1172167 [Tanacetum coccineum]
MTGMGRNTNQEFTGCDKLQDDCDVQATNIIFHGLPPDVYALVNYQEAAKDIWDRVKMRMKGTGLSYQEHECRLYNLFNKFAYVQGETLYEYYWRFSQLINDMHTIGMTMQQLAKSLYTTKYDQLYAYLNQHERHANEVCITHERYLDPLAFVANSPTLYNPSQSPHYSVNPQQHLVSPPPCISPSVTQQSQTEFPQLDSSLAIPTFQQGDDPIECINKAMAFLSAIASRFPPSNNQLRTSSNPRNQATIQDGKVTVQQVQGRQTQSYAGTENREIATTSKGNYTAEPRISEVPVAQQTISHNSAFQTNDLDAYVSDCDDLSLAKAVLMANLSICDPKVLSEVPYSDSYPNDIINQDVQEMQYSEQTHFEDFQDNEIHSDSNIIPYSQYLQESQDAVI